MTHDLPMRSERAEKLFVRLFDENPAERETGLRLLEAELRKAGAHPCEVRLLFGSNLLNRLYGQVKEMEARLERAEKENQFFRRAAPRELVRRMRVALDGGSLGWEALRAVLVAKVGSKRGWRAAAAEALGMKPHELRAMELGDRPVTHEVVAKAQSLPQARRERAARRRPVVPAGASVADGGPMGAAELHLIGLALDPADWASGAARVVNVNPATVVGWSSRGVPQGKADALRRRWRETQRGAA